MHCACFLWIISTFEPGLENWEEKWGGWLKQQRKGIRFRSLPFQMSVVISLQGRRWPWGQRGTWWYSGDSSSEAQPGPQVPGEKQGNGPVSGWICIFLITQIYCKADDSAGLVLFSCPFLLFNIVKWSTVNGHPLNRLAQHVQHWEEVMIISGPLLRKPVEAAWGRVKV